jgi:hypothetical protein
MSRSYDMDHIKRTAEVMHTDERLHGRLGSLGFIDHLLNHSDGLQNDDPAVYDLMASHHRSMGNGEIGRLYEAAANFKRAIHAPIPAHELQLNPKQWNPCPRFGASGD